MYVYQGRPHYYYRGPGPIYYPPLGYVGEPRPALRSHRRCRDRIERADCSDCSSLGCRQTGWNWVHADGTCHTPRQTHDPFPAPDGGPCKGDTRGLLQRAHIVAGKHRRIGKESDRRWEEGDDFESLLRQPIEYQLTKTTTVSVNQSKPRGALIRQIQRIGIRKLIGFGCSRRTLAKICNRELVHDFTLHHYEKIIREYKMTHDQTA